jgi:uncharacterized membrane-anchored protein YhcB (DUF1043 family)
MIASEYLAAYLICSSLFLSVGVIVGALIRRIVDHYKKRRAAS